MSVLAGVRSIPLNLVSNTYSSKSVLCELVFSLVPNTRVKYSK